LLGVDPSPELIERYRRAEAALFPRAASNEDAALLEFVLRRPSLLPLLDAAAGLLRPANRLRRKLVVLSAILEADPAHVDRFLPAPARPSVVLFRLCWSVLVAAGKIVLGLPVYLVARRSG
jgi:hypothetical protein